MADAEDFRTIKHIERFEDELFKKLKRRKRAMLNWQKIKVVLAVIKLAGDKLERRQGSILLPENPEKQQYRLSLDEKMVKYIILPTSIYIVPWSVFTSLIYVVSYWNDSKDLAQGLVSLLIPWKKTF